MSFDDIAKLTQGWDSYDAPPISAKAINIAENLVRQLEIDGLTPTRINPSVVGAIGITFNLTRSHYIYIEVYNKGNMLFAIMNDEKRELIIITEPSYEELSRVINEEIMSFAEIRSMCL